MWTKQTKFDIQATCLTYNNKLFTYLVLLYLYLCFFAYLYIEIYFLRWKHVSKTLLRRNNFLQHKVRKALVQRLRAVAFPRPCSVIIYMTGHFHILLVITL
jgi:preprotein translocase subunit SecY